MKTLRRLTLAEQTAEHLRNGLRTSRWSGKLPGVLRLAEELGVSKLNVRAALRQLESEGWIGTNGPGRSRVVQNISEEQIAPNKLRVAMLLNQRLADEGAAMQRTLLQVKQTIESAGHECIFAPESQARMKGDVRRIIKMVQCTPADAWFVLAGTSELLQWFADQPFPTYALGGGVNDLPLAASGTNNLEAHTAAVRHLVSLGHRRLVLLCPRSWREPRLCRQATIIRDELAAVGTTISDYHLPDWEETPEGLQEALTSLFRLTPPTALIVVEPFHAVAVQAFLATRGLQVGRDVSLICMIGDPALTWQRPALAHFHSDDDVHLRHISRWVHSVSKGQPMQGQKFTEADFIPGETISPVNKG